MKTKLVALLLLAGGSVFAGPRVAVGFGIGVGPSYGYYAAPPPPPPPVYVAPAPAPYYPVGVGFGYGWGPGYWGHRPYARVAPRVYAGRPYAGHFRR
jgi:hypothetical protein